MPTVWTLFADYDCHVTTPAYKTDHYQYVYIKMPAGAGSFQYGIFRWDVSDIANTPGIAVAQVRVRFHVDAAGGRNIDFSEIETDPLYAAGDVLASDVDLGPILYPNQALVNGQWYTLGAAANADLTAKLVTGYWALAVSFIEPQNGAIHLAKIRCTNPGSGANPRPTLEVTTNP